MRISLLLWTLVITIILTKSVNAEPFLLENSTWEQNITPTQFNAVAFGDVNNNGIPDLAMSGCLESSGQSCSNSISKVYINNGTSLVENSSWEYNLIGLGHSSLAWGDLNNDGKLDLVLTGCTVSDSFECTGTLSAKVYINNGTSLIENSTWDGNLTGVSQGNIALEDIDNDGRLDIVMVGETLTNRISKVYINNGTSLIENSTWDGNLTGVSRGSISIADINNDGFLDLSLTGIDISTNKITKIYINNGSTFIENYTWQQNLYPLSQGGLIFGDFNNDNDMDMVQMGCCDYLVTYKNNGTTFVQSQIDDGWGGDLLAGLFDGSIAFGDYDNNGYLDFAGVGRESGRSMVYRNNGTGYFWSDYNAAQDLRNNDFLHGSLIWNDVDNDNNLDLIAIGMSDDTGIRARVYINNASTPNIPPNASTTFSSSYSNNQLNLSWGSGSDAETNASGLYYNLRAGTMQGGNDIVSGVYGGSSGGEARGGGPTSGYFGNMMQRRSIVLNVPLESGQTLYWSVQTIDTGLAKSFWSVEQSYTIPNDTTSPTVILNAPADAYNTTNATITFNATVYDDTNLTNVTLYGSWGGWHLIATNSSGLNNTNYFFSINLSSYGDGSYTWMIAAFDNYSNYQESQNRTFTIDTSFPIISLISPLNAWSSGNSVTFTYNVSDAYIANCSLIVNGAIDQTSNSITTGTEQVFTKSLPNGNHEWSVNCTDIVGHTNSSEIRTLAVSYIGYTFPSSGGGGWIPVSRKNVSETEVNSSISGSFSNATNETSLKSGETITAMISSDVIRQIIIHVKSGVKNIEVSVESISSLPDTVPELDGVYRYLLIDEENFTNDDINGTVILFSVNRTWMAINGINESTITLQRYTTSWDMLETVKVNETDEELMFEAFSPGMSYFAITGERNVTIESEQDTWIILIAAAAFLAAGFLILRKRRRYSMQSTQKP